MSVAADPWLAGHLACPREGAPFEWAGSQVVCPEGHAYPVRNGVPVLLLPEARPTQEGYWATGEEIVQISASEAAAAGPADIDPYVKKILVGTCGKLYRDVGERLTSYPIPELRLPPGDGRFFLEVGCNWGRWCLSATRRGYVAVGIDPSLGAIEAARRVAAQLEQPAHYAVAEGRHLPFEAETVDVVFSYSVLQHLDEDDVIRCLTEMRRVLRPGGTALVQMPNAFGLRNMYLQLRRGFASGRGFDVRYWTPGRLRRAFESAIGPTRLSVDGFFSLNPQGADLALLPFRERLVVQLSGILRRLSERAPLLVYGADSVYVWAKRERR